MLCTECFSSSSFPFSSPGETAENSDKKYVQHGWVGQTWAKNLYDHGILSRRELPNLWRFDGETIRTAETLGRGDGTDTLAEVLIKVLMQLDLVFEHSGLLQDMSSDSAQQYYLVPEVWSERLKDPENQAATTADVQALSCAFNPRNHIMTGWQVDVQGWLLPSFFRKFVCQCATALTAMGNVWSGSRVTLSRNGLRWESASWPDKERALALWLEQSEPEQKMTIKIAGLKRETHFWRGLNAQMAHILQKLANKEHVDILRNRLGTLPPGSSAADDLVWIGDEKVEQQWKSGQRVMTVIHNGRTMTIPLYPFVSSASPCDVIPNFDTRLPVARMAHDPEFLLHCRGYHPDMTSPPAHWAQAKSVVKRVMAGHWGTPFLSRLCIPWINLLESERTRKRIQILDLVQYGVATRMLDCQLFVTLPFRNLYFPIESFYSKVLDEFREEVMKMFRVLRAKQARITLQFSIEHDQQAKGRAEVMRHGVDVSLENHTENEIEMSLEREWRPPSSGPGDPYPLNAETWFFLAESGGPHHALFHGLDLLSARDAILSMKRDRIESGAAIGRNTLKVFYSRSQALGVSVTFQEIGTGQFENARKKTQALKMEYEAQVYEWNESTQAWE